MNNTRLYVIGAYICFKNVTRIEMGKTEVVAATSEALPSSNLCGRSHLAPLCDGQVNPI